MRDPANPRTSRPPSGQRQIVVWLDEALKREVQKLALDREQSLSELVRGLLEKEVARR